MNRRLQDMGIVFLYPRAEGPLGKGGLVSYLVSARRSLIEETSPWLVGEKQALGFNSVYVKVSSLARDGGSRCSLTAS